MDRLQFASVQTLQKKIKNKEITPKELLEFCIKRFADFDHKIESALEIFDKESIEVSSQGVLAGIAGLIKDNITQKGRIASCGSKILENYKAPYDATSITKLKNSGAVLLGRANMDEFAMGSSTETSAYKKTKNPWNFDCVPGGSSGGSAAAVAAGLVPWALGSETGGSVRQPAALCGIVGFKPTYGLVSRYGLVAYGSSLDQIGTLTRTVWDNALILSIIAGKDKNDATSVESNNDYVSVLDGKLDSGFTIGIIDNALEAEGFHPEVYASLNEVIKEFERLGAKIKRVKLPTMDYSAATYFIVSRAEAASNLARFDGVKYGFRSPNSDTLKDMYKHTRFEGFGPEVKSRILIGNYVLSAGHSDEYYKSANIVRGLIREEFKSAFQNVDLLFAPTAAAPAFKFGAFDDNKLQMDLQDYFTAAVNLAGIPAISVPCGFTSNKMPMGFQLIGPALSEAKIFKAAHAYEAVTPWHTMHPEGF